MEIKREFVEERLRRFNDLCFGGTLPLDKIQPKYSTARTFEGKVQFVRFRGETYYVLFISGRYDHTETELEDTILHEMIHIYLRHHGIKDTSNHGLQFRQMMDEINRTHGRHITVTGRLSKEIFETDSVRQWNYICVITYNGQRMFTRCSGQGTFAIYSDLQRNQAVTDIKWYATTDPHFNRYPARRTSKFYDLTDDIQTHLATATPMVNDGSNLYPVDNP